MTDKNVEKTIQQLYQESRMARKRLNTLLKYLPDPVFAFTLDKKVEFINPAFERVFGWTLDEIKGKNIKFIPKHLEKQAKDGMRQLFQNRAVLDFETQRYTKDGRLLDIVINGSILYDEDNKPIGQALILRDMTHEKRMAKSNQVMFNISRALHQYSNLGGLIDVITREIKNLLSVEGAFILLANEAEDQLYFLSADYKDEHNEKQFKKLRFAADQGISGRVYKSGEPLMIQDVANCSFYLKRVNDETDLITKNMLSVPMKLKDKTIGVISVVNKQFGDFDDTDQDLLSMLASTVALPIENTRIHEKLQESYNDLQILNKTKDRVINHLAHELKTPASVLEASLKLVSRRLMDENPDFQKIERILERGRRNLRRILEIQYEVEDLLREKKFQSHFILHRLIDTCRDEIETLVQENAGEQALYDVLKKQIDDIFGPRDLIDETIVLDKTLGLMIEKIQKKFDHRNILLDIRLEPCGEIFMPIKVLETVVEGILRNSVEYTPNNSKIKIRLAKINRHPELMIKDYGIGMTREKLHLIFENYFTPPESGDYSTRTRFDFNAGGRGFDLLRIKLFSERYPFDIRIRSKRCRALPGDLDLCPGEVTACGICSDPKDCAASGGSTIRIRFTDA